MRALQERRRDRAEAFTFARFSQRAEGGDMQIQWFLILAVAFTVVGMIQFAKGFAKGLPSWFWGLMLPAGCVGVAAAFLYLPPFVMVALLAMGLSQLGYENIVQLVKQWIQKSTGLPGAPAGP
jgi:hypothetical protein